MVSLGSYNLYVHHYFKESYTCVPHPEPSSLHLWWIHFDIWQNQYNTVKLKKKHIKEKKTVTAKQKQKQKPTTLEK